MKEYMEEKYLLIKTSILEVEEIKDNLCSKCVELTEEEIKNMLLGLCGGDGEYWSDTGEIEKLRKVL